MKGDGTERDATMWRNVRFLVWMPSKKAPLAALNVSLKWRFVAHSGFSFYWAKARLKSDRGPGGHRKQAKNEGTNYVIGSVWRFRWERFGTQKLFEPRWIFHLNGDSQIRAVSAHAGQELEWIRAGHQTNREVIWEMRASVLVIEVASCGPEEMLGPSLLLEWHSSPPLRVNSQIRVRSSPCWARAD